MHRSYVAKEWMDRFLSTPRHPLPADAAKRFFSILRIKPEEEVAVFDGQGRQVEGLLAHIDKQAVFKEPVFLEAAPPRPRIVLLQAATVEAKMHETIKRGSEWGVDHFIIFNGERCEPYCFNKLKNKNERLMSLAQDACRQSNRLFIPAIEYHETLACALKQLSGEGLRIFGQPDDQNLLSKALKEAPLPDNFFIAVGPEGGFGKSEMDELRGAAFIGVSWSPFVLRTELAGIAAVAICHAFCGKG